MAPLVWLEEVLIEALHWCTGPVGVWTPWSWVVCLWLIGRLVRIEVCCTTAHWREYAIGSGAHWRLRLWKNKADTSILWAYSDSDTSCEWVLASLRGLQCIGCLVFRVGVER